MSERYPYNFDRTTSNAIGRLNTIGYRDDEQIGHNEMVSDIRTIIDHIESLQAENERLREVIAAEHFHHKTPQNDCYKCVSAIMEEKANED